MKEDFVTYGIAVKLGKKGFNIDTDFCYNQDGGIVRVGTYPAPQIHQVLKWLREEKKLYIVPLICSDWSEDADGIICEEWLFWSYRVFNINDGRIVYDELNKIDNGNFENYEQASLAGIEYVIDNLI